MNSGKGGGGEIDSIMAPKEMNPRTKSEESSQRMTALMPELILQRSPPRGCQGAVSKGISLWNEKGGGEEGLYKRGQSPEDKLVEAPVRCESGVMSPTRRRTTEKDSYDTMGEGVGSVPGSENHGCDPDIDEAGMKSSIPRSGQRRRPSDVRCEPDDLSPVGHRITKKDSCATKEARCGSVTLTEKFPDNSNLDGERGTNVSTPQSGPVVIRPAEVKTSVDVLIESCKTQPDDSRTAEASPSGIHSTINIPGVNPNTPHSARRGRKPSREMRMLADTPEFVSAQKRRGSSTRRALRCKRRENAEPNDLGNRLLNATGYGEDTAAANSETAQGDAFENSDSHEMKARATSFVDHRAKRKGRTASQSSSRKNSNGSKKARRDQSNDFPERGNASFPASSIIGTSLSSEEKCRNVDSSVGKTSVSLGLDTGAVASGNTNAASNEIRVPDEG